MKILNVVKKVGVPALGILVGTAMTAKYGEIFAENFKKKSFEDKSVEIEEHDDGSFTVKEAE